MVVSFVGELEEINVIQKMILARKSPTSSETPRGTRRFCKPYIYFFRSVACQNFRSTSLKLRGAHSLVRIRIEFFNKVWLATRSSCVLKQERSVEMSMSDIESELNILTTSTSLANF